MALTDLVNLLYILIDIDANKLGIYQFIGSQFEVGI